MRNSDEWVVLESDEYEHRGLRRGFLLEVLVDRGDTYLVTDGGAHGQYVLPKVVLSEPEAFTPALRRAEKAMAAR